MAKQQGLKNVIFLYNPISGEAEIIQHLDKIAMHYQRAGYVLTLFRITRERGLSKLGNLINKMKPEHLLVAGGDGTINRLVNYLKGKELMVPLAILPMGTANDFAHMIGMPDHLPDACKAILGGTVMNLDLGRVNNHYFVNVLSSGLFTDVSQKTPTILKNTFGKLAYYVNGLSELPTSKKMKITVKSEEHSFRGNCWLLLVFNGRTAGNFRLASRSEANDGLLDVLIIKGENIGESIRMVFQFLIKRSLDNYPNDVVYFQTKKLLIESNHPTTDIDGEHGPDYPLEVECLAGQLPIIVPKREEPAKQKRVKKSAVKRK